MATYTPPVSSPRFAHLRAYLVGVGVTASLTAGALVVFLSLATFLAFNALPFGGSSDDAGAAYLDSSTSAAPTAAGAALGAARGAVAKDPAPGYHRASAAAASGGTGSGGGDASGKVPFASDPSEPGVSISAGDITPPAVVIPLLPSTSGPVTDVVQGVDNAAGTDLSGSTGGVTGAADGGVSGAVNRAGRATGRAGLGRQAGGAVSGATDSALGL